MKKLDSNINSKSRLDSPLRLPKVLETVKGIIIAAAIANRYAAITSGGASANLMKIAAKEMDSTPINSTK